MGIAVVQSGTVFPVINGGGITSTTAAFTDTTSSPFKTTDAGAGNNIYVVGAGAGSTDLSTGISVFTSATAVTLGANAGTTVANAAYAIGNGMTPGTNAGSTLVSGQFLLPNIARNWIIVQLNWDAAKATPTISDSAGNTYKTAGTVSDGAGTGYAQIIFYAPWIVASATNKITISFGGGVSGGFTSINFFEVSGIGAFEQFVSNSAASGTAITSGNIVTKAANDFIVAGTGVDHTVSAGEATWTILPSTGTDHLGDIAEYTTVGVAGTYAATATQNTTGHWVIVAAVFSPPGATVLPVQRRTPGFPPPMPLPGIVTLGSGILIATQPVVPPAPTPPLPVLNIQQRAPGFPLGAPIPGIVLLGSGILQPTPSPVVATPTQPLWFGTE